MTENNGDRPVDITKYYGNSDIVRILKRNGGDEGDKKTGVEKMDELRNKKALIRIANQGF